VRKRRAGDTPDCGAGNRPLSSPFNRPAPRAGLRRRARQGARRRADRPAPGSSGRTAQASPSGSAQAPGARLLGPAQASPEKTFAFPRARGILLRQGKPLLSKRRIQNATNGQAHGIGIHGIPHPSTYLGLSERRDSGRSFPLPARARKEGGLMKRKAYALALFVGALLYAGAHCLLAFSSLFGGMV